MIAHAIVSPNELPSYLPEKVKEKVKKVKVPVNQGAEAIITTIQQSQKVTLDQILKAIDNVTEEQAYAMLDTLNNTKIQNTDQLNHSPIYCCYDYGDARKSWSDYRFCNF